MSISPQEIEVNYGQETSEQTNTVPRDLLAMLDAVDLSKKNGYIVLSRENGDYMQTLRTPIGFIIEIRYTFADTHIHYRAWTHTNHTNPGKVDPRTGEWGPYIHERDHIPIYQTASCLSQYINSGDSLQLPEVKGIHWRDVTDEFPEF